MATLKVQLYQLNRLILDHLPGISAQLQDYNVEPFLYATSWFLTLFCSQFPLEFCNFVLDNVLLEGVSSHLHGISTHECALSVLDTLV